MEMKRHVHDSGLATESHPPELPRLFLVTIIVLLALLAALTARADDPEVPYPHGEFEEECSMCHSPTGWTPAVISRSFDHSRSDFALEGAHRTALCRACHLSLEFNQTSSACVNCHLDVHRGELGVDCAQCHTTSNFIDHADEVRSHRLTRFPLSGAHTTLQCAACHPSQPQGGLRFVNTPVECEACHLDLFLATKDPDHAANGFDRDCSMCHSTTSFDSGSFDHFDHSVTGFPLAGAHRNLECAQCHTSGQFGAASAQCFSCHQGDFESTASPNHVGGGFPTDCQQCHTSQAWSPADFDHDLTAFPLTGSHTNLTCQQCHGGGSLTALPPDCNSCHDADYQEAPNHVSSNFQVTCEECHNTITWADAVFNHDFFPFVGGHSGLSCQQCHTTGVYETIPADCNSCHNTDYQQAPGHVSGGFPLTCNDCHSINTWAGATFDHGFFPLSGGHNGLACEQCHTSGTLGTIPADCASCHQGDFQQAPGHVASNFPQTCEDCHSVTTWTNATFDHGFFALNGAHTGLACQQCHTNGIYETMPTDCVFCHQADYVEAPGHLASNFPQTCETCHTTTTWLDATFDHGFFPLSGGHNGITCVACHTTGVFGTIPADCFSCHQNDYQLAPGHAGSFPTTCQDCHAVTTWLDATFDHGFFQLNGGHNGLQCVACHTTGVYGTIPSDCFSCHQNDFTGAPEHQALNFPHDCESCHSTNSWIDVNFFHSFPLSGPHGNKLCSDCHDGGTTNDFSCLGACHEHRVDKMDDKHKGESGYAYDFNLCLSCHPNGRH
jgi:Zn finger protein HypA/HybF involved in hydrogenase expression